ncbi:MAG: prolyl oligopeptidase family serine peptidase [Rubrivivax sp.]
MQIPRKPVTKTIGPVTFSDDYAWLEEDTPETQGVMWALDAQAQEAAHAAPAYEALKKAIAEAGTTLENYSRSVPRLVGALWFWAAPSAKSATRALWAGTSPTEGRVVVEQADFAGPEDDPASTTFHWFEPSPNAEFVVCGCVSRGSMLGSWRVVEVASGRVLDVVEPCAAYTGGLPGWLPDASGYFLADRAEGGQHRVRFVPVKAGTAARAARVFEFAEIAANVSGITIEVAPGGRQAIALAGPHERIALMLGDVATGQWRTFLPQGFEGECQGAWKDDAHYVARAHGLDWPNGRVVDIPVATSQDAATWQELVPQRKAVLRAVTWVEGHAVLADVEDCAVRLRVLDSATQALLTLDLKGPGSSLVALAARRFERSDALCFDFATFVQRTTNYRYDFATRSLHVIGEPGPKLEGISVTQHFARSIDGEHIPYFVVHRDDLDLSRPNPALLTGYGGFNMAMMPSPLSHITPFVRSGGIFIHSNLRGGGEYGKHWHEAGRLACKWNVFADLFAVAEKLIADKVTEPAKLAMMGGSNGGLLAGVAIVHRPELWRVVVPIVPLFDMMEPLPDLPHFAPVRAIFLEDYGDPKDAVLGKVTYSYSPYHNIRSDTAYPAVFQIFGEKDMGCLPFHGRKFTAALRAATTSGRPVHMRVWKDVGHGPTDAATSTQYHAEWLAFVMQQLDMDFAAGAE